MGHTPQVLTLASALGLFTMAAAGGIAGEVEPPPWQSNAKIATIQKQLYKRHPAPRAAALVSMQYVGPGLQRREVQGVESVSDVADQIVARWSTDNGRTWSAFVPVQPSNNVKYGGLTVWEGE